MAYNHEYPYTDPNRINGDWLLNEVKTFKETLENWSKLAEELKEALAEIGGLEDRVIQLEEAVNTLNPLIDEVAALQRSIENLAREDIRLEERINSIVVNYDLVLQEIEELRELYPIFLKTAKQYTDDSIAAINRKINIEVIKIEAQIEELKRLRPERLYNPARGAYFNLQQSYDYTYADMRDDAITVAQFAGTGITVSAFNALNLRSKEFMLHGFSIFHLDRVTSPVSGLLMSVSNALSELFNYIVGAFTVSQFDALDLTSDDFEALDYTVLDFLLANDANRGLTVSQFNDIVISGGSSILRTE